MIMSDVRIKSIIARAKRELSSLQRLKKSAIIGSSVLFPILEAFLLTLRSELSTQHSLLFWVPMIMIVFVHVLLALFSIAGSSLVQEMYFESREILDELEELKVEHSLLDEDFKNHASYYAILVQSINDWRVMQGRYRDLTFEKSEEIAKVIKDILVLIVKNRRRFFGFDADELWSFALYVHDENRGILIPIWRSKHDDHPSTGIGREWSVGVGHIGVAFAQGRDLISADVQAGELGEALKPNGELEKEYDGETYRALASIPITSGKIGETTIGILVATSNNPSRFDKFNCQILLHAAGVLGNFIHINDIATIKLLDLGSNGH